MITNDRLSGAEQIALSVLGQLGKLSCMDKKLAMNLVDLGFAAVDGTGISITKLGREQLGKTIRNTG